MANLSTLVRRYRSKGVLVDSNLLIVYLIGHFGVHHLANCRATKNFSRGEFDALRNFLGRFEVIVTTPHVLTEVSNLAGRLPAALHVPFRSSFAAFVDLDLMSEQYLPSKEICRQSDFVKFGLADAAITQLAPGKFLVLTDELALANSLGKRGVDVINFNHVRFAGGLAF